MFLKFLQSLQKGGDDISRVVALCWSPNNRRLALADHRRFIFLYDEKGERKDKFSTKPSDPKGAKSYLIRGLAFSPDSTKLAVAQSDNIVFVYKLGLEWGERKSICNKFQVPSSVVALCWPKEHPGEVIFATEDGHIRLGVLRNNKSSSLFVANSYPVSLAASPDGMSVISGHVDGSIHKISLEDRVVQQKICHHTCPPVALSWGENIVAAGVDSKVFFYDERGSIRSMFDFASKGDKEFTCASFNASGSCVALASTSRLRLFDHRMDETWELTNSRDIVNAISFTCLSWKPDGNRLVTATLDGQVDSYDVFLRRRRYKDSFEFTYVSPSQVIVKRLATGHRIVLKSHYGHEIRRLNIYREQFLVAHTIETILLGDLASFKLSEVLWNGSGNENFFFDHPSVCMIYNAGELTLVEYGRNEILGSCRTEHVNSHQVSVCILARKGHSGEAGNGSGSGQGGRGEGGASEEEFEEDEEEDLEGKKIAYLIDRQTIRILNLSMGVTIATINHESKIDWLELNHRGTKLLFRDQRHHLHLYDIETEKKSTLLSFCSYVQWVPDADVVVAQNRGNLCVWYNIDAPDRVTIVPINGEVVDIMRADNQTVVKVEEALGQEYYELDEKLVAFWTAMEDEDIERAADILESQPMSPEIEAMWTNLAQLAMERESFVTAERCYAALGDVAKAKYLHGLNRMALDASERYQDMEKGGYEYFGVQAGLAVLKKDFKEAEHLYVDNGEVEEAMGMYEELHKYEDSIAVAERTGHENAKGLKETYFDWLLETKQEEKAALLKEKEGKYLQAINLYLQGGLPSRAANVCIRYNVTSQPDLIESISASLMESKMFSKAGEFLEKMREFERAVEAYMRGHAYQKAVELSRKVYPGRVVELEEIWGDYLVSQRQVASAVNHFMESGNSEKAISAAIQSRQWTKAVQILDTQDPETAQPYMCQVAEHYEETMNFPSAEKHYVRAGLPERAFHMYIHANHFDSAHRVASSYMSSKDATSLYLNEAKQMEHEGKWREAEKLYLRVGQPDLAINMYKKAKLYDDMLRLVSVHRKEHLSNTHVLLAKQFESEKKYEIAERYYASGGEWQQAVAMYRYIGSWEDAYRVAKIHGGHSAAKQVLFAWSMNLGAIEGGSLLQRYGLMVEEAASFAADALDWDFAFGVCRQFSSDSLPLIHEKYAVFLETNGRFLDAEEQFLKAGKPKDAVEMYTDQKDWTKAIRVAKSHAPDLEPFVHLSQAKFYLDRKDFHRAAESFVLAQRPEEAVNMYVHARMWEEAQNLCKEHCPDRLPDVNAAFAEFLSANGPVVHRSTAGVDSSTSSSSYSVSAGSIGRGGRASHVEGDIMRRARALEDARQYSKAIDAYLEANSNLIPDSDILEELLENACRLAMNHVHGRIGDVFGVVGAQLRAIGRQEQAAEMYLSVEMFDDAAIAFAEAGAWDRAQKAGENASGDIRARVQDMYVASIQGGAKRVDVLVSEGQTHEALELYASQHEWEQCLELAVQEGPRVRAEYAMRYAVYLVGADEKGYEQAVKVLSSYGVDYMDTNAVKTMLDIVRQCVFRNVGLELGRNVMIQAVEGLDKGSSLTREVSSVFSLCHLSFLAKKCSDGGLKDLVARQKLSLLRYVNDLPADRAFFEAGMACKEAGMNGSAFVLLNRYIDLIEMMEDPDETPFLENADFEDTDIPYEFDIPETHALAKASREEARSWILMMSLEQSEDHELSKVPCERCGSEMFEGNLKCHSCGADHPECIVSGFPVVSGRRVECRACGRPAVKEWWNAFVNRFKQCPVCGVAQTPIY
eukprot:TRINITY_DN4643_c0_g1_i1.p1 TRINITY_DN4643_c0_g1~~TRINITY_DN4643_c0_g1_i1.p1  ORF type:complete len:1792 (-),score=469.38 TRINITY_DN4643_c0_g1_i1:1897-7272(-)